jgi:hypothetical protein
MVSNTFRIEDENHQKASEHAAFGKQRVCGITLA